MTLEQACDLAEQRHREGDLSEAESLCRQILSHQPGHARALQLLATIAIAHGTRGNAAAAAGRFDEAAAAYQHAISLRPDYADAHFNLANVHARRGAFEYAIAAYRQALALRPDDPEAWNNLGSALMGNGAAEDAVAAYRRAIELRPQYGGALNNLGKAYARLGMTDLAISACRQSLALQPDVAAAHYDLGHCLVAAGRPEEAIASYQRAIQLRPQFPDAVGSLGRALWELGDVPGAAAALRHAASLGPQSPSIHFNWSLALLAIGDFQAGFREYEARRPIQDLALFPGIPEATKPEDFAGQNVLLHAEQGFGDTFWAFRYVPLIAAMDARVTVHSAPPIRRLLEGQPSIARVICGQSPDLQCQTQSLMMSLPRVFRTASADVGTSIPFIHPDPALVESWKSRLASAADTRLKIGLVWSGNSSFADNRSRSIPPELLSPLSKLHGVRFFSLQKGPPAAEKHRLGLGEDLIDLTGELSDFADTAALMANLDLVMTVDTAIANLAGAMGLRAWVLLHQPPDWRWQLDSPVSPWYPTLRLFRQSRRGDWQPVIDGVVEELTEMIDRRAADPI